MTLNRRHKAILFLTLVVTGCSLLLGAELKEALAFMMLGAAFAWAIGSDVATKLYSGIKGASGTFYSWIRVPLAMALAGGLLGAVLLYSRANPVVVVVVMCAAGVVMSPLSSLPTPKIWLRIPLMVLAGIAFILAAGGMVSTDLITSNRYAERQGQLAVTGFIALVVGIFWLSKGWRLIQNGIAVMPSAETPIPASARREHWDNTFPFSSASWC